MNFSFQRGSHLLEREKEHESPDQFRKRYTKTLSEGFKDFFSTNPEGRKEEEVEDLKLEEGSDGPIS